MADKEFLRYRIHSVSSQAEPSQALKLLSPHQSEGWVSKPQCVYPQYIAIQFFLPVKTLSMNLLLHQYKIPTMVEIFVKEKSKQPYQRLGCIRPANNEQTGWQQRELKTVYFEYPCSFIKLVFHQPFANRYNILKQVAIEEITVRGVLLDPELGWLSANTILAEDSSDQEQQVRQLSVERRDGETTEVKTQPRPLGTDLPEIQSIFQILHKKKQEAVQEQNFQLASLLKAEIINIKQMDSRLVQLEQGKKRAIEMEDYNQADVLKTQILRLKQNFLYELSRLTSATPNRSFSLNSPEPKYYQKDSSIQMSAHNNTFISQHDSQVVSALANKIFQSNQAERRQDTEGDSQVLRDFKTENKIISELDSRTQMQIEKYQHIIPREYWVAILGKNWKSKEGVFAEMQSIPLKRLEQVLACLQLCSFSIRDKHPSGICSTLQLILRVANSQASQQINMIPQSLTDILSLLPLLLVDSNAKVRQLSTQCLLDLPDMPCVNINLILSYIVPKKSKATKEIPKLTQAKLVLCQFLFTRYKFTHEQSIEVLEWAVVLLEDPNNEVRNTASGFIIEALVPALGAQAIKNKVKNIRPNALSSFLLMLNTSVRSVLEDSKLVRDQPSRDLNTISEQDNSQIRHQSIDHEQVKPKQYPVSESKQEQIRVFQFEGEDYQEDQDEGRDLCDYCKCKLEGPDFDRSLEEHLAVCKMMVTCEQCSYIVEIRSLCDHLLHQCENSKYHQCSNCGLAFPFVQLHSHKAEGSCKARKKGFQRCQICATDVPPNDDAWVAHSGFCR